jgi:acetyltransferase-like isoleucine patch superfamily enzyme
MLHRWNESRRPSAITVGAGSIIGNDVILDGREGIHIGENVNFSSEVAIWTLQHDHVCPDFGTKGGPVTIGDRTWVSFRATILPDVTIGEGVVVAAGAVVTRDVQPYAIVGGIPARVIGYRERNLTYNWTENPRLI